MNDSQAKNRVFDALPTEKDLLEIIHTTYGHTGCGEDDPRSVHYKRSHVTPEIDWRRFARGMIYPLSLGVLIFIIAFYALARIIPGHALWPACAASIAGVLAYALMRASAVLIWIVKAYQHFAPVEIRNKCRFEPSCSVYMIQAIEKYGAIKGVSKGIKRLRNCNTSHGGYDYP